MALFMENEKHTMLTNMQSESTVYTPSVAKTRWLGFIFQELRVYPSPSVKV